MVHHARGLRRLLREKNPAVDDSELEKQVAAFRTEYVQADLFEADRAMLDYSVKLTVDPSAINDCDVQRLRDVGFDDRAIHDIVCCVGYFAFVNRIAEGLGVQLESD